MKQLAKISSYFSSWKRTLLACVIYYGAMQLIFKILGA